MKHVLVLASITPVMLYGDSVALSSSLALLASAGLGYSAYLLFRITKVEQERDQALEKQQADANILYLQSRYASMGETLGNIAHQWKQPLNAIGSIQNSIKAALIFQGEISKEKLLSSVDTSFGLLQHLAETIDTFYSFLAQSGNRSTLFFIADELEKVRKITEYSFENSNIRLVFELNINPAIQGNANEFTHALLNLILNAKDAFDTHTAENPTITVRVVGREETCTITVTDNAGGIRIKPIEMVFDLHMTTKENGSGLGLFMTKNIIESRFGGNLSVNNTKDGACFTIELPYAEYNDRHLTLTQDEKLTLDRINELSRKVIELEEIEKTLRKWSDIFKKAHWAIAIHIGTSNNFESTNEAFNALYGYAPEELKDISVPDLFPSETISILSNVQNEAFKHGYTSFETLNKRKDGSIFPVSVELIVIKDEAGEILYHIANIWDLTEKKASEERLLLKKFALDHIRDAVFLIDEHARFHYVNEGACHAHGYTQKEMINMGVGDVDLDWPSERWQEHWEALKKARTMTMELRHRRKDGTIFPVEVSANYIEYNGHFYNMAVARDITERKVAEEKLLLHNFALNKVHEAIYLIDENSMFHYVNEGACKALGYTKSELLTMGVVNIDPNVSIEWWKAHWNEIIALGTTLTQTQHIKKDGTSLAVEVSSNSFEYNGVWYSLAVSRDITDRLALEAEKESRIIKTVAENSPDVIIRYDVDGRRTYANPKAQELLGVVLGKSPSEETPIIDKERYITQLHNVIKTGQEASFEITYTNALGTIDYSHIRMVPEFGDSGKITSVLMIGRNVTEYKQTLSALEIKERELRALAESSPGMMGAYYMRPDGSVCMPYASPNIHELFGITPEEIQDDATPLMALSHPDDAEMIVQSIQESAQNMSLWHIEYRIIHPTKGIRWMEGNTMPQPHPEGGTIWYGYVHDITERKTMEASVQEANDRYIQILDNSTDVIYLLDVTPEGKYVYVDVNAAYETVTGIPRDVVIGLCVDDIEDEIFRTILIDKFDSCLNAGCDTDYTADYPFPGGVRTFHSILTPIRDESGRIVRIVGSARDITEQKAMEENIRQNEKNLNNAQKLAKLGSWHLDIQNGILTWSDETYRIFELEREAVSDLYSAFYERIHSEEREYVRKLYTESFETKTAYETDHRIVMDDGRIKYVIERCEHTYAPDGTPLYSNGTVQDITERKVMENELRKALEFNEGVISAIPDLLFEIAPDGTYVGVWAQNEELLIQQREAILGKNFKELMPPDVVITSIQAMKEVDEKGLSLGKTYSLHLPDGKRWFELSVSKKKMSGNYIALSRDITERKHAEEQVQILNATLEDRVKERTYQLMKALEFNEGIINALPDLLFEVDRNGRYMGVWTNNPHLLAAQKEVLLNRTFDEILSPEATAIAMDAIREAEEKGLSFGKIIEIELADGIHWFELSASKKSSDGTFIFISRDISERIKAEKTLQEREEMFRALVENSPDVISRYDLSMRRTYANPMMQFLLDKPLEDILGKTPREFSPLPDVEVFEEMFKAVVYGKTELEHEGLYQTPWGEIRWGNQRLVPEFDSDQNVTSVMVIGRDITERKNSEKRLLMVETAINSSTEAIYISDQSLNIIYVNDGACRMLGYNPEELLGMSIVDIEARYTSEEIHGLKETTLKEPNMTFETRHLRKDGSIIDVEIVGTSFTYENDEIILSVVTEITERKKMEKALRYREEYQRTLLDNFPYFVWLKDKESRLMAANIQYARVANVQSTADLVGKTDFDFFPHDLSTKYVTDDQAVIREGKSKNVEEQYADEHGDIRWMETWKSPVWVNGEIVGTVGCSRDITERKEMETALRESEARYREIFDNSSDALYLLEVTPEGRYKNIAFNRAFERSTGIAKESLMGTFVDEFPDQESARKSIEKYDRCVRLGEMIEETAEFNLPQGIKTYRSILIPIKNEEGRVVRIIGLAREER